jgi:hypothetical protein
MENMKGRKQVEYLQAAEHCWPSKLSVYSVDIKETFSSSSNAQLPHFDNY